MPTYSGGLGMLAGDTLRAAADLAIPIVGLTLLYRKGYFHQHLDASGNQTESPALWSPEKLLEPMHARVSVIIEGRKVQIRAWRYVIRGVTGHDVPVFLLDTAVPRTATGIRSSPITSMAATTIPPVSGGSTWFRRAAMLLALVQKGAEYHMNEGHSALLTLALLEERHEKKGLHDVTNADREAVHHRVSSPPTRQSRRAWTNSRWTWSGRCWEMSRPTHCRQ